jgi:hypothetical protein
MKKGKSLKKSCMKRRSKSSGRGMSATRFKELLKKNELRKWMRYNLMEMRSRFLRI